jgi:ABC-type methionine transport system ATPase subunit
MHSTIQLIELKNIEKVFLTDEVETHALSAVTLEIHHGDSVYKEGLA